MRLAARTLEASHDAAWAEIPCGPLVLVPDLGSLPPAGLPLRGPHRLRDSQFRSMSPRRGRGDRCTAGWIRTNGRLKIFSPRRAAADASLFNVPSRLRDGFGRKSNSNMYATRPSSSIGSGSGPLNSLTITLRTNSRSDSNRPLRP